MENESQNNNLSEQEKMDALVAELAGESNDPAKNDLKNNNNNDDENNSETVENIKNNEFEETAQNADSADPDINNLSEQEKMDALVAELAGESNDPAKNDLKNNNNNDDENKSEPIENIKNNKFEETSQNADSADSNIKNLSEQENFSNKNEPDDFNSLDDDEIEHFDAAISTKISDKKITKKTENVDLNISTEKENTAKKPTINKLKKQIRIKKYIKLLISLFLLLILFSSVFLIYKYKTGKNHSLISEHQSSNNQYKNNKPLTTTKIKEPEFEEKKITQSQLEDLLKKIDIIIDELQSTKNELDNIIRYYKDGIKNVELAITKEIKKKNIHTFKDAIKNMRIKLGIETIQRRLFYFNKLEKPFNQLNYDIEELIFLKRKIKIAIQIMPLINETEIANFQKDIETALIKHISVTDKLFVDNNSTNKLESFESIWAALPFYEKTKDSIKKKNNLTNIEIWEELSNGNFDNVNKLTKLSIASAECLSKWKGKDLYLNNITTLTPQITKKLIEWKGEWLCLNGLSTLSPETAKYLFKWDGKRISLNAIKQLSPKEAEYISGWQGNHLEMINLNSFSPTTAQYLTKWLEAGGKIYINDKYR
ncbi:hypothetical protein BuS5_03382 [Desulfosarcina sp. BuS5]|uniref:hypothetical protein n=1 Tax=Desulfosarcina sp. BuS5 TaxID=933262 RepID=UPI00048147F4|nr:hypothetical protein [Desulfosarcina sp. BuS5]WDN90411.1 hypothetical protein BuS5_03382 [Desulfosarcina sp. BuS5]